MEDQNNTNPEEEKGANNDAQGQNDDTKSNDDGPQSTGGVAPIGRVESVAPPTGGAYTSEASTMFSSGLNLGFINQKV
ncbi:MAG: hypothetical protein ACI857_002169, partial [Arenicella sp.]